MKICNTAFYQQRQSEIFHEIITVEIPFINTINYSFLSMKKIGFKAMCNTISMSFLLRRDRSLALSCTEMVFHITFNNIMTTLYYKNVFKFYKPIHVCKIY